MFQLIQRQGSSRSLMALFNDDGSVAKAWPVHSVDANGNLFIGHPEIMDRCRLEKMTRLTCNLVTMGLLLGQHTLGALVVLVALMSQKASLLMDQLKRRENRCMKASKREMIILRWIVTRILETMMLKNICMKHGRFNG